MVYVSLCDLRVWLADIVTYRFDRHWAKESLPALLFANPSIPIVVEPAVVKRPSRNKGKGKEVDTTEGEEAVVVVKDSWKVAPGVTIAFRKFCLIFRWTQI